MLLDVTPEQVAAALATFPGLPHRLEELGRLGRHALHQRQQGHQCRQRRHGARGIRRRCLLDPGRQAQAGRHHVARIVFPARRQGLSDRRGDRGIRRHAAGPGGRSSAAARWIARSRRRRAMRRPAAPRQPVVLLSPACASFDQYRNFEVRGDAFRALVEKLPGIELRRQARHDAVRVATAPAFLLPGHMPGQMRKTVDMAPVTPLPSCSPPAEPAAICFRPLRWRRSSAGAPSRSIW